MKYLIILAALIFQTINLFSQCDNYNHNFLYQPSCSSNTDYVTTNNPKTNNPKTHTPHPTLNWKKNGIQYIIYYGFEHITNRDPSFFSPSSRQVVVDKYDKDMLIPLLNNARNSWHSTCNNANLIWANNSTCRFYWEEDSRRIKPNQITYLNFAFDQSQPGPYNVIPISSNCYTDNIGKRTEVMYNNSLEFYRENPTLRWTTEMPQNVYEISFYASTLHILGHYYGLFNQWAQNHFDEYVMNDGFNKSVQIQQCEADSFRMLYCPEDVGKPLSIEDNFTFNNPNEIDLIVYPNPSNSIINISFKNENMLPFSILIRDLEGRLIKIIDHELLSMNEFKSSFVISDLSNGEYFLTLIIGTKSYTNIFIKK